jgi:hypothetical protein
MDEYAVWYLLRGEEWRIELEALAGNSAWKCENEEFKEPREA